MVTGSTKGVPIDTLPHYRDGAFTGRLEDIRPIVRGAWASVVPLRLGGGTRVKVLEALALGTPVVSTSKGVEGLNLVSDQEALIADRPSDFAAQTVRLLSDPGLRRELARRGRRRVERDYGWAAAGDKLREVVERVVDARTKGR